MKLNFKFNVDDHVICSDGRVGFVGYAYIAKDDNFIRYCVDSKNGCGFYKEDEVALVAGEAKDGGYEYDSIYELGDYVECRDGRLGEVKYLTVQGFCGFCQVICLIATPAGNEGWYHQDHVKKINKDA